MTTAKREDEKPEFARLIQETDWPSVTRRLLLYAEMRLRTQVSPNPYGRDAEDYVLAAVSQVLEGIREFSDPKLLFRFLAVVVDELIRHDAESVRLTDSLSETVAKTLSNKTDIEQETIASEKAEKFFSSLAPDLERYARLRLYGEFSSFTEYARALGIEESEVRNLDRRLRRMRARY
jgi:DNA-directed RNA polymerase specialized sigma24 family protein